MPLTPLQEDRLVMGLHALRESPGWSVIRDFHTAEASDDPPDFDHIHKLLMVRFQAMLLEEKLAALRRYGKA
jgi:hypothetical protein